MKAVLVVISWVLIPMLILFASRLDDPIRSISLVALTFALLAIVLATAAAFVKWDIILSEWTATDTGGVLLVVFVVLALGVLEGALGYENGPLLALYAVVWTGVLLVLGFSLSAIARRIPFFATRLIRRDA